MMEHVDELLALYALGGLEPDELERVEAHLAECAVCRKEAQAMRALAGAIGQSAPPVSPPAEVYSRLSGRLHTRPAQKNRRPIARLRPAWILAPLTTLAFLLLFSWNLYLNTQLNRLRQQVNEQQRVVGLVTSPTTQILDLAPQENFPAASGRAYIDQSSQRVVLIVQNLRPLQADETYQAWVIEPTGPRSAGLFTVNELGWGMTTLTVPYPLGSAIGVSREPAGGNNQPTEVVLVGGL